MAFLFGRFGDGCRLPVIEVLGKDIFTQSANNSILEPKLGKRRELALGRQCNLLFNKA